MHRQERRRAPELRQIVLDEALVPRIVGVVIPVVRFDDAHGRSADGGQRELIDDVHRIDLDALAGARRGPLLHARLAEVNDVVGSVLFLIGPAARFITGQTIHVNGGRFMP